MFKQLLGPRDPPLFLDARIKGVQIATKCDELSSVPRACMAEGEN